RRVERPLLEIEVPGAALLCKQTPLQAIGKPRDGARERTQLLVEERPQPLELVGRRQILRRDLLVEGAGENAVAELLRIIQNGCVRAPWLTRLGRLLAFRFSIELVGIGKVARVLGFAFLALGKLLLGELLLAL